MLVGLIASLGISSEVLAQQFVNPRQANPQPPIRAYAPPVHIAPGGITALPPNHAPPKTRPGLELVNSPHHESEPIGFQDRLAQSIATRHSPRRRLQSAPASSFQFNQSKVVGSGLRESDWQKAAHPSASVDPGKRPASPRYPDLPPDSAPDLGMLGSSVIDTSAPTQNKDHQFDSNSFLVPAAATQDGYERVPPVRHAFVQDHARSDSIIQEFEWVEEPVPAAEFRQRGKSTPARSTSVLRHQDGAGNPLDFQPQPGATQADPFPRFQPELELLDQASPRRQESQNARPRSLLDIDETLPSPAQGQDPKTTLLDRTCSDFQRELLSTSIRDIALDLSPPAVSKDRSAMTEARNWTDRSGQPLTSGTMIDLRRGYVILEDGRKIAFARLSEADLIAVSKHWNIPPSCLYNQSGMVARNWHRQSFTWTASSLCHKPLYFENIQLERYGHSHGPVMQPFRSAAHFFVRLVTLPYHTAIHPPNECEYPLGLYRPGDCAPWLKDPIPISLDGMRRQALVTTGVAFIP
jgi:hypothetical protein